MSLCVCVCTMCHVKRQLLSLQQGRSGQPDHHLPVRGQESWLRVRAHGRQNAPLPVHGSTTAARVPVPDADPENESRVAVHVRLSHRPAASRRLDLQLGRLCGPGLRPVHAVRLVIVIRTRRRSRGSRTTGVHAQPVVVQWRVQRSHPLPHRRSRFCVSPLFSLLSVLNTSPIS